MLKLIKLMFKDGNLKREEYFRVFTYNWVVLFDVISKTDSYHPDFALTYEQGTHAFHSEAH